MPHTKTEDMVLEKPKTKFPPQYKVIILNDDLSPFEFVIWVLMKVFKKDIRTAEKISLDTHEKGSALVGVYLKEIAEAKVDKAMDLANQNGFPLTFTTEKE